MCANQRARWTPSNGTFLFFFPSFFAFCFSSIPHLCYAEVWVYVPWKPVAYIWNRHSNELCMECREREFIEGRRRKKAVNEGVEADFIIQPLTHTHYTLILFSLFFWIFCSYPLSPGTGSSNINSRMQCMRLCLCIRILCVCVCVVSIRMKAFSCAFHDSFIKLLCGRVALWMCVYAT